MEYRIKSILEVQTDNDYINQLPYYMISYYGIYYLSVKIDVATIQGAAFNKLNMVYTKYSQLQPTYL